MHIQKEWAAQPVRQEGDLVGRHVGGAAVQSIFPTLRAQKGGWGKEACSFRSYYADQVRNGVFSASPPVDVLCSAVFSLMGLIRLRGLM
jgi:hypothetical protein